MSRPPATESAPCTADLLCVLDTLKAPEFRSETQPAGFNPRLLSGRIRAGTDKL